jgi:hypothetical protein
MPKRCHAASISSLFFLVPSARQLCSDYVLTACTGTSRSRSTPPITRRSSRRVRESILQRRIRAKDQQERSYVDITTEVGSLHTTLHLEQPFSTSGGLWAYRAEWMLTVDGIQRKTTYERTNPKEPPHTYDVESSRSRRKSVSSYESQ